MAAWIDNKIRGRIIKNRFSGWNGRSKNSFWKFGKYVCLCTYHVFQLFTENFWQNQKILGESQKEILLFLNSVLANKNLKLSFRDIVQKYEKSMYRLIEWETKVEMRRVPIGRHIKMPVLYYNFCLTKTSVL